ncbi:zinc ABC transporter substrate-binding protein [Thermosphaera chiliense]|uniref:Zinc ABC transporter substrate-binding protein n=1 Tax=Thermosphaera chiliense TaxID=3402707 RepID=A0A7M1UQ78_9CREN|nr:zinc ABC transporter substrate-binding protein [Thermosphaera aggregans]QOR94236.1 zinc ABC transporter substrate-binding protein [Thermosphaera aggregans]
MRKALIVFLIIGLIWLPSYHGEDQGLTIVATFSSLVPDISLITCPGDTVKGLIPAGVDPHEYMLTPDDVNYLKKADVIVSTAHTHAELQIKELVNAGELDGRLVEVSSISGIRLLKNPNTGQPNYHAVLYDPLNYLFFTYNLTMLFSELNPSMRDCYMSKYVALYENVLNTILVHRGKYDTIAVADAPLSQYAVEWLGIKVVKLVKAEHDAEASSMDLLEVEKLMRERLIGLVIVTYPPTKTSEYLEEQASLHGVPILKVESPLTNNSFLSRLSKLVSQNLTPLETRATCEKGNDWSNAAVLALSGITGAIGLAAGVLIKSRVRVRER